MNKQLLIHEVRSSKEFLQRVLQAFTEEDSAALPYDGMFTLSQQVAHIAQTVEWLVEGATNPAGFDMDFENLVVETMKTTSLLKAGEWLDRAYAMAESCLEDATEDDLAIKLPEGIVMGGLPRASAFIAIIDHTAHHRGAISVYARALGRQAPMPYMDM
jgi:uncharacterized damage-inducible protein DinB